MPKSCSRKRGVSQTFWSASILIEHRSILILTQKQVFFEPVLSVLEKMSMQQNMHFQSGLLSVEAGGEFSLEDAKQAFLELLEAVARHKAQRILFDARNVKGKPRDMERFYYGEFAAGETFRIVVEHNIVPRFAYVIHEPLRDPTKLGETVAVNRGMNVKTFENQEDAIVKKMLSNG